MRSQGSEAHASHGQHQESNLGGVRHLWARLLVAVGLPVAVAAAWIPLRARLPLTDLALVLVLVVGGAGWLAGWRAALVSAVAAGAALDLLDTPPYGTLAINRPGDIWTALVLVVTGFLVGAGASRLAGYRDTELRRSDALAVVMEASGLVATGQEGHLVTEALAAELRRELEAEDCSFHPIPPGGTRPTVARDGSLVGLVQEAGRLRGTQIDLPVWSQGEVLGHYRIRLGARRPSRQELRVALSLADQAGAAMSGGPPPRLSA